MDAFFISIGIVALAEMGDKTQLLALILAIRFKKPLPIILGILAATLVNHSLAGAVGIWVTSILSPEILRWIISITFILIAIWTLLPDKIEENDIGTALKLGVFGATFLAFFLAEMGDKTQIATITLTAHYKQPLMVIAGTSIGMLLADIPAVFLGHQFADKIPMNYIRFITASLFALMGLLTLIITTH